MLDRANSAKLTSIPVYDVKVCDQRLQATNSGFSHSIPLYHVEAANCR